MRHHEIIQANFRSAKRYWEVISAPKFKNSEIYVVTLILKKIFFIPSQVFSGKISSGMEQFSAYMNQRFSLPPTMRSQAVWAIFVSLILVTTLYHLYFNPVLATSYGRSTSSWNHGNNEASTDIYDEESIHQFQPKNTHKIQQQLQKHRV